MTTDAETEAERPKGSEALWLDAAHRLLIEQGVDAVKISPLAKALGVSRTSFYWHFADREALLDALIARWREKNTGNLIRQTELYAETAAEAVFNLFDCWIDDALFDARLDFAVRNWAQTDPALKCVLERQDQARIAALEAMFARFGKSDEEAAIRARTVYYTQTGYIAMRVEEPLAERLARMPAYAEIYCGVRPSPAEIARFQGRHQLRLSA